MFDSFEEAQNRTRVGDGWSQWCGAAPWVGVKVPVVDPLGWSHWHIRKGLAELERVRREAEAAMAVLIASLPITRDSTSDLVRNNGISTREAKRLREVADVAKKLPDALTKLREGEISADHVAALSAVKDLEGAEKLLEGAGSKSPEALAKDAEQFKLASENGEDTAKRQWSRRSFRCFKTSDGMVGLSGLLPPLEGAEFRARLEAVSDAKWRVEHPERAETLGGHNGETVEQRLADALLHLTGTPSDNLKWPTQSADRKVANPPQDSETSGDPGETMSDTVSPSAVAGDKGLATAPVRGGVSSATVSLKTEKRAVVIVFNVDAWQAQLIGGGPVPVTESLFDRVRNDLFYSFTNMAGEVIKFGRARRDPTPIQRLVVMSRDLTCVYPGCNVPANRTDVHHFNEYARDQGGTDTDTLGSVCPAHHQHLHLNDLVMQKEPNGSITIRPRNSDRPVTGRPEPG